MFCCCAPLIYELLMGILLQIRGTSNNFFFVVLRNTLFSGVLVPNDYKIKTKHEECMGHKGMKHTETKHVI